MDYKKFLVGFTVIALVATVGLTSLFAAYGDNDQGPKPPHFDPEKQAAVKEAIANNDYQTWQELTEGSPIAEKISEDNFDRFVEAHQHIEKAREI